MSVMLTLSAGAGDCYCNNTDLVATDADLGMFEISGRTWIPFVVPAPKSIVLSATLKVRASATTGANLAGDVDIGCEAADNPSTPTDRFDLASIRVMTTAKTPYTVDYAFVAGTQYSFDVTAAVQEIFNRAGWAKDNTMAVMMIVTYRENSRFIVSNEGGANKPVLEIVINNFIPSSGGLV